MSNYCYYEMKLRGKRSDCEKWVRRMRSYDEPHHFYRIFSADVFEEGGDDADYHMKISGDCAWSLESCCRASGYSNGIDLFAINSAELNIKMEAYSQECGLCFQEHYVYDKGICATSECVDWESLYYDRDEYTSFDEFKNEYDIPEYVTEDDLNDGYYERGGFVWWKD